MLSSFFFLLQSVSSIIGNLKINLSQTKSKKRFFTFKRFKYT